MTVYSICDTRINCNILEQIKYNLDGRDASHYLLLDSIWKDTAICNKFIEVENKVSNSLIALKALESRYIGETGSSIYNYLVDFIDKIGEISRELAIKQYNVTHIKDLLYSSEDIVVDSWLAHDASVRVDSKFKTICDIREANSDSIVEFFTSPFKDSCDNENNRPFNIIQDVEDNLSKVYELLGKIEEYICNKEISVVN
jgi:predicted DNA-binding transcriptional regulator